MSALTPDDRAAITALSHRYASRADDRGFAALAALFAADGVLEPRPGTVRTGPGAIAAALEALRRYDRTFHLVGQVTIQDGPDGPIGQTYCVAHHFTTAPDGGTDDHVMYIRYHDRFTLESGEWRFAHRRLDAVATEDRPLG